MVAGFNVVQDHIRMNYSHYFSISPIAGVGHLETGLGFDGEANWSGQKFDAHRQEMRYLSGSEI